MHKIPRKLWGGFVNGKLDVCEIDTGWGGFGTGSGMRKMPAIFMSQKTARQKYQDVRPLKVKVSYAVS